MSGRKPGKPLKPSRPKAPHPGLTPQQQQVVEQQLLEQEQEQQQQQQQQQGTLGHTTSSTQATQPTNGSRYRFAWHAEAFSGDTDPHGALIRDNHFTEPMTLVFDIALKLWLTTKGKRILHDISADWHRTVSQNPDVVPHLRPVNPTTAASDFVNILQHTLVDRSEFPLIALDYFITTGKIGGLTVFPADNLFDASRGLSQGIISVDGASSWYFCRDYAQRHHNSNWLTRSAELILTAFHEIAHLLCHYLCITYANKRWDALDPAGCTFFDHSANPPGNVIEVGSFAEQEFSGGVFVKGDPASGTVPLQDDHMPGVPVLHNTITDQKTAIAPHALQRLFSVQIPDIQGTATPWGHPILPQHTGTNIWSVYTQIMEHEFHTPLEIPEVGQLMRLPRLDEAPDEIKEVIRLGRLDPQLKVLCIIDPASTSSGSTRSSRSARKTWAMKDGVIRVRQPSPRVQNPPAQSQATARLRPRVGKKGTRASPRIQKYSREAVSSTTEDCDNSSEADHESSSAPTSPCSDIVGGDKDDTASSEHDVPGTTWTDDHDTELENSTDDTECDGCDPETAYPFKNELEYMDNYSDKYDDNHFSDHELHSNRCDDIDGGNVHEHDHDTTDHSFGHDSENHYAEDYEDANEDSIEHHHDQFHDHYDYDEDDQDYFSHEDGDLKSGNYHRAHHDDYELDVEHCRKPFHENSDYDDTYDYTEISHDMDSLHLHPGTEHMHEIAVQA